MKQPSIPTMEFIPGHGYRWSDGKPVFQKQQLSSSGLPIGHIDHGEPWAFSANELHVESAPDGFWVMDRLGSYHRHPWETLKRASEFLARLKN